MPVASQRMHGTTFRALKVTAQVTALEVEPESAVCDYLVASCHRQCGASGLIKTIVQGLPGMERVVNYCLVWVWLTAVVALMSSCGCGFSAVRLRSRPNRRCSSRGSPLANGTKSSPGAVAFAVLFGCEILYTETRLSGYHWDSIMSILLGRESTCQCLYYTLCLNWTRQMISI